MLQEVAEKYLNLFPGERPKLKVLLAQLKNGEKLNGRTNYTGHITGSAIILSPDKRKLLLIHHPAFDRWQQPGGHWDSNEDGPWLAARRESEEETGVQISKAISLDSDPRIPLIIDSHLVPASSAKNEPKHYHHDFRYGFIAQSEQLKLQDHVIKEAEWVDLNDPRVNIVRTETSRLLKLLKQ